MNSGASFCSEERSVNYRTRETLGRSLGSLFFSPFFFMSARNSGAFEECL